MNSASIEFDGIKEDSPAPKIVRKSFRVPVEDSENISVVINGTRYPLQDIAPNGVGIKVADSLSLFVEQGLLNCELHYFDSSIKNLKGKIVHMTAVQEKEWKYGIQWTNLDKAVSDKISAIVYKLKKQLLEDDQDASDDI